MSRAEILTAQIKAKIDKAEYCLKNIDTAATAVEVFIGEKTEPVKFYMTGEELKGFLKNELETHKQFLRRFSSRAFGKR